MDDLGKVGVIAAIMGAILLVGLLIAPSDRSADDQPAVVVEEAPAEITVVQEDTLEMLDPVYSEKAVYQDGTIRIAFDASYTEEGLESRLPFWLHNVSGDVINVLWDRCSIQLPDGNTVGILSEESLTYYGTSGGTISVAPSGDLFDAIIPVSEFAWLDDGWSISTDVFDEGTFTLVLAIERGDERPRAAATAVQDDTCAPGASMRRAATLTCEDRAIVYYTFRFVVR